MRAERLLLAVYRPLADIELAAFRSAVWGRSCLPSFVRSQWLNPNCRRVGAGIAGDKLRLSGTTHPVQILKLCRSRDEVETYVARRTPARLDWEPRLRVHQRIIGGGV